MLCSPNDMKAPLVGHLDHFKCVLLDLAHVRVRGDALHVDGQLKFHYGDSYSVRGRRQFSIRLVNDELDKTFFR